VLTEYALAPIFGSESVVCILGANLPAMEFSKQKQSLRVVLAQVMNLPERHISFSPVVRLREQQFHKPHDFRALRKELSTGRVLATCLVEVRVDDDVNVDLVPALGRAVQAVVCGTHLTSGSRVGCDAGATEDATTGAASCSEMHQALISCGATYIELPMNKPGDEAPDIVPNAICGVEVTEETLDAATERWAKRVIDAETYYES
jgi:hypothetical protein